MCHPLKRVPSVLHAFIHRLDLPRRFPRSYLWTKRLGLPIVITFLALSLSLVFTPKVEVSAFGQTVEVGAVAPSLSFSGPGEANLFGEGTVDTVQKFNGPIRPLIEWQHFNHNDQAGAFIQSTSTNGNRVIKTNTNEVGQVLASGWRTYFIRYVGMTGAIVVVLYLLALGLGSLVRTGRMRTQEDLVRRRRQRFTFLASTTIVALLTSSGFVALTAMSASDQLGQVTTLADLVGTAKFAPVPSAVGKVQDGVDIVVLGDSTAAAIGNQPVTDPTPEDTACQRSSDAYANVLQLYTGQHVVNLACSGATILSGIWSPQQHGGMVLPPQLGVLKSIASAKTVIVSIGANDVVWSDSILSCYALTGCDDIAIDHLFQSRLDGFKLEYLRFLQALSDLDSHPTVIVNLYYNPFGAKFDCKALQDPKATVSAPSGYGFSADPGQKNQPQKILSKIDPLVAHLTELNQVLQQGAENFGFLVAQPHFEGHELCTSQPWIQGMDGVQPFHPTAAGELAIEAVDQALLPSPSPASTTPPVNAAGAPSKSPGP